MYCKRCGSYLPDNTPKCNVCGEVFQKPKTDTLTKVGWFIVGTLLGTLALIVIIASFNKKSDVPKDESPKSTGSSTENVKTTELAPKDDNASYEITSQHSTYYKDGEDYKYFGIIEITNTGNCNLKLNSGQFSLEDNNGHLLQVDTMVNRCPDIIAPGEKGYYFTGYGTGAATINPGVSLDNGLNLKAEYKIEKSNQTYTDFDVSDLDLKENEFDGVAVTGRLYNASEIDYGGYYVTDIFFDKTGKAIYAQGTNTEVHSKATTNFEINTLCTKNELPIDSIGNYRIISRCCK